MNQHNHNDVAYRAWQADPSDQQALRDYVISLARSGEVPNIEQIIELENALDNDSPLRKIYDPSIPRYYQYFQEQTYRQDRWRALLDRYAGRIMNPQAAMFLSLIGHRSDLGVKHAYELLWHFGIIGFDIFFNIENLVSIDHESRYRGAQALGEIGPAAAVTIPHLINSMGDLINSMGDGFWAVRHECARTLGKIGPAATVAIPALAACSENDDNGKVRDTCRVAITKIQGAQP